VLCFAKDITKAEINLLPRTEEMNSRYKNPDSDTRENWKPGDLVANEERKGGHFIIKSPKTGKEFDSPPGKHWSYSKDNMLKLLEDNRIYFGRDGNSFPSLKQFISEVKEGRKASTLLSYKEYGHTDKAKKELKKIFYDSDEMVFNTPKPSDLIKNLIILGSNIDDIILDSFAGTGTTAQAILELNKKDDGNRKFILIEMEDYANEITAERVRRVIKGIPKDDELNLENGTGGTFSYFELGEPIEMESILRGNNLPAYTDLARYVFYTATGEQFIPKKVNEKKNYIGETKDYEVYLFYKPDLDYLRSTALTLKLAQSLGKYNGKKKLVFAPAKYVDTHSLLEFKIEYCQLPFEIYRIKE
jgi:adenine-specific DNA-methyltransferase